MEQATLKLLATIPQLCYFLFILFIINIVQKLTKTVISYKTAMPAPVYVSSKREIYQITY